MTVVDLRTIPGVELVKTGTWDISTGQWIVTSELIAAAVAAHNSGALPKPILKLGHVDARFDGEPALGWVDNLRTTDGGNTLVGDFVGCPAWLADIAASAYPNRSVEAVHGLTLPDGTVHPLALTAATVCERQVCDGVAHGVSSPSIVSMMLSASRIASLIVRLRVVARWGIAKWTRGGSVPFRPPRFTQICSR